MTTDEPELMIARRAFPESQRLLAGAPTRQVGGSVEVGWFDQDTHPETAAIALVTPTSPYGTEGDPAFIVGELLRVSTGDAEVFVYVYATEAALPADLCVYRRAFLALGGLWRGTIRAVVETL